MSIKNSRKKLQEIQNILSFTVYDQIIGVVDFTNIHIFGITCSLAWLLPHKTFFHAHHAAMHNSKISISVNESDKIGINEQPKYTGHLYHFDTFFNR